MSMCATDGCRNNAAVTRDVCLDCLDGMPVEPTAKQEGQDGLVHAAQYLRGLARAYESDGEQIISVKTARRCADEVEPMRQRIEELESANSDKSQLLASHQLELQKLQADKTELVEENENLKKN